MANKQNLDPVIRRRKVVFTLMLIYLCNIVGKRMQRSNSSDVSSISTKHMEQILETLKWQSTRSSTAANYHTIWKLFNKFILKLDYRPETWEQRCALYGAYLVDRGAKSATVKSYFSAIKKVLEQINYKLCMDDVLLNSLAKACRLVNDRVKTRLPISSRLLEQILFEVERKFSKQYYLECMYKAIFSLAYYGLLRIGELTNGPHVMKAKDVQIAVNKEKILITLYTSKTHGAESRPQEIKISSNRSKPSANNRVRCTNRLFCPFKITKRYFAMRGNYYEDDDQFFVFRDGSPVYPSHVKKVLREILKSLNFNEKLFDCHSFRIGRCSEMIKLGIPIEVVKRLGRWRSNAVYRYIRQ